MPPSEWGELLIWRTKKFSDPRGRQIDCLESSGLHLVVFGLNVITSKTRISARMSTFLHPLHPFYRHKPAFVSSVSDVLDNALWHVSDKQGRVALIITTGSTTVKGPGFVPTCRVVTFQVIAETASFSASVLSKTPGPDPKSLPIIADRCRTAHSRPEERGRKKSHDLIRWHHLVTRSGT